MVGTMQGLEYNEYPKHKAPFILPIEYLAHFETIRQDYTVNDANTLNVSHTTISQIYNTPG